jgi:L-asparaginase II
VLLAADGSVQASAGRPGQPVFPRSANKPMQAAAMLRAGLRLGGELLALAAASHSGEEFHVAGVREILAGAGLTVDDLQCPADLPLDTKSRNALLAGGGGPDRLHMNCSGKHAGMLATCAAARWPTASYLEPAHPLQRQISAEIAEQAGEQVAATGVDGCGAPVFAITLTGLASAFRAMVLAAEGTPERRVADAMRAYPSWMSGTNRSDRRLMEAVPGLLVKSGAEGVIAFAYPAGWAGAVKVEDGAQRAVPAVAATLLRGQIAGQAGSAGPAADAAELARLARPPVYGGGAEVGQIRVTWPTWPA